MNNKEKKIRIIYNRLQGLNHELPLEKDKPAIEDSTVQQFHSIIDELSSLTGKDYSKFKVPISERENWANEILNESPDYYWKTTPVRAKIIDLISQIGAEYNIGQNEISLKGLIKKELKNIWAKKKTNILFFLIFLVVATILSIFKINLFNLLGIEFSF